MNSLPMQHFCFCSFFCSVLLIKCFYRYKLETCPVVFCWAVPVSSFFLLLQFVFFLSSALLPIHLSVLVWSFQSWIYIHKTLLLGGLAWLTFILPRSVISFVGLHRKGVWRCFQFFCPRVWMYMRPTRVGGRRCIVLLCTVRRRVYRCYWLEGRTQKRRWAHVV